MSYEGRRFRRTLLASGPRLPREPRRDSCTSGDELAQARQVHPITLPGAGTASARTGTSVAAHRPTRPVRSDGPRSSITAAGQGPGPRSPFDFGEASRHVGGPPPTGLGGGDFRAHPSGGLVPRSSQARRQEGPRRRALTAVPHRSSGTSPSRRHGATMIVPLSEAERADKQSAADFDGFDPLGSRGRDPSRETPRCPTCARGRHRVHQPRRIGRTSPGVRPECCMQGYKTLPQGQQSCAKAQEGPPSQVPRTGAIGTLVNRRA